MRSVLIAFAWIALEASCARAQVAPVPVTTPAAAASLTTVPLSSKDASTPALVFDVVSIKIDKDGNNYDISNPPDGDGITITGMPMFDIFGWNYDLYAWKENQLHNVPGWFTSDRYDIQAKVADSDVAAWQKLSQAQRRLVFRKVLVDRFKFAMHFDSMEQPIYDLVLAKGGPKLKQVTPGDPNPGGPKAPDGTSIAGTDIRMIGAYKLSYQEVGMTFFARWLTGAAGRPVYDKNSLALAAAYDFTLEYNSREGRTTPVSPGSAAESESNVPSLFTSLQEQLGLKLESGRGPVSHPVVDHIERPTAN